MWKALAVQLEPHVYSCWNGSAREAQNDMEDLTKNEYHKWKGTPGDQV